MIVGISEGRAEFSVKSDPQVATVGGRLYFESKYCFNRKKVVSIIGLMTGLMDRLKSTASGRGNGREGGGWGVAGLLEQNVVDA